MFTQTFGLAVQAFETITESCEITLPQRGRVTLTMNLTVVVPPVEVVTRKHAVSEPGLNDLTWIHFVIALIAICVLSAVFAHSLTMETITPVKPRSAAKRQVVSDCGKVIVRTIVLSGAQVTFTSSVSLQPML